MFEIAREIYYRHQNYEYMKLLIYAPEGWGKTSLSVQILADLYGEKELVKYPDGTKRLETIKPDWDAWKTWMKWLPEDFEERMTWASDSGRQQLCLVWNDAGAWAHKNRRFAEWAMRMSESSQMWRRWYGGVIFNTPDPTNLLNFLRGYNTYTARVNKVTGNPKQRDLRYLRVYEGDITPDLRKGYRRTYIQEDWFNVKLPDQVFKEVDEKDRYYARILHERQKKAREEQGIEPVQPEEIELHTPGRKIIVP